MKTKNKWLGLWIKPKSTFKQILNTDPYHFIIPLAIFNGILGGLIALIFLMKAPPEIKREITPFTVVSNIIGGAIIGLIILYLGSLLLKWTGNWIGGKGKYTPVKAAVGWTNYPLIVASIFGLISALLVGYGYSFLPFEIIKNIIFIWAIVILIFMLSEAHQFSVWKALLAFVIAAAIGFAIVVIIGFIIGGLSALFVS